MLSLYEAVLSKLFPILLGLFAEVDVSGNQGVPVPTATVANV